MDFKNWLIESESIPHQELGYMLRVNAGKNKEIKIIEILKNQLNWNIIQSSEHSDMNQGIDAVVLTTRNSKILQIPPKSKIQIKTRQTGDDVLMETIKPFNQETLKSSNPWTGRDMKGESDYYIILSKDGNTLMFRKTDEAVRMAKETALLLINKFKNNVAIVGEYVKSPFGMARVVADPSFESTFQTANVKKVNVFLSPEAFQWKFDYVVKNGI